MLVAEKPAELECLASCNCLSAAAGYLSFRRTGDFVVIHFRVDTIYFDPFDHRTRRKTGAIAYRRIRRPARSHYETVMRSYIDQLQSHGVE